MNMCRVLPLSCLFNIKAYTADITKTSEFNSTAGFTNVSSAPVTIYNKVQHCNQYCMYGVYSGYTTYNMHVFVYYTYVYV